MERYYRSLRWREVDKLEEARVNFWTKIDAAINEAKSCESVANRDAEESRRERKLMNMELEGRIDTLLGGAEEYQTEAGGSRDGEGRRQGQGRIACYEGRQFRVGGDIGEG